MPDADPIILQLDDGCDDIDEFVCKLFAAKSPQSGSFIQRNNYALSWTCCLMLGVLAVVTKSDWPVGGLMSRAMFLIGLVLSSIACIGRIWCSFYIDGFETWRLVTSGPYSACRNPMCFFTIIGAMGIAFGTGTLAAPFVCAVGSAVCYLPIIHAEERRLLALHGESFVEYCRRVPTLLPQLSDLPSPQTCQIHSRIVGNSMLEASRFVWFTLLAHLLYQLHQRTDFLPAILNSH